MNSAKPLKEIGQHQNIGATLAIDKDPSHYKKQPIWSGLFSDFMQDNKAAPATAIQSQLDATQAFAYRAIGVTELAAITTRGGIGGSGYSGTLMGEGTLFSTDLAGPPLAMMDGRSYGGGDDRGSGGYIIAIPADIVKLHAQDLKSQDSELQVVTKIPIEKLHAIFQIEIKSPTLQTPDDIQNTYHISKIVQK